MSDSSILQSHAKCVFRDPVHRRQRYDTNCRYIAERRDTDFQDFTIAELIPLAFYTLSTDLEKSQDIKLAGQIAAERYESDKCDLFSDWQKYCKVLRLDYRAVAIFEGSIFFAAKIIPRSDERDVWLSDCLKQLQVLKCSVKQARNTGNDVQNARRRKRKREQPEASVEEDVYMARMAEMEKVKATLGVYLFVSMKTSRTRKKEEEERMVSLTDTVRLYFAVQEGEDFKLNIWISSSAGESISKAHSRSVDELRDMLGDYLFEAMEASKKRKSEQNAACTGAVAVLRGAKDEDSLLEVILCFAVGKEIYATMYSS
ncbi:hypothetical protein HIM_07738 [Hirsutella minnesotensis 3608]|uniref:Uncharacterized protein n=1 Tax=Hirsutella minnesotensis 3608 TaxID=1043627 RepID=A0A0F8A416_9HYPO|nr:hypothetical protein HIM_07738 [Hirsutella minnesotensis 3608]